MTLEKSPTHVLFIPLLCYALLLVGSLLSTAVPMMVYGSTNHDNSSFQKVNLSAETRFTFLLPRLLADTTTIVQAQVIATESRWHETESIILTEHTLAVIKTLTGDTSELIQIETVGGYLPEEELGLWVSHEMNFPTGEDLILFLSNDDDGYHLVGGNAGKYQVNDGYLVNQQLDLRLPTHEASAILQQELTHAGRHFASPQITEESTAPTFAAQEASLLSPSMVQGEPPKWLLTSVEIEIKANLNSDQINDSDKTEGAFYTAIRNALRTWSVIEQTDFTLLYTGETDATETGYNEENEILFMHKGSNKQLGQAQIWYTTNNVILEVDIWINDDYALSVDDDPAFGEMDLESIILHEVGHWAPLDHLSNPESVMYSVLASAQRKRTLHDDDIAALVQLYPCDLPPCIHEAYQDAWATPTPRPTATPTSTPTPTFVPTTVANNNQTIYLPYISR